MLKKILFTILAIIVLFVVGVYIYVQSSWDKTYDWPGPALKTTTDSATIAKGSTWSTDRRIVYPAMFPDLMIWLRDMKERRSRCEVVLSSPWVPWEVCIPAILPPTL